MYDTHVHSKFSSDGISDIKEYINLFDEGKIDKLGLAEHRDFLPCCGAYGFLNFEDYYNTVRAYREKGYEIYAGAEIDYARKVQDEIISTLEHETYDYTICSIHMIDEVSVSDKKNTGYLMELKEFGKLLESYYYELESSIKADKFDVIAHIGVYKRYIPEEFFVKNSYVNIIIELEHELAKLCADSGHIIEVNTSGLFSPHSSPLPGSTFLKEYYRHGGRKISIGSDAHDVRAVARGFSEAESVLRNIGFKYVCLPWDKKNLVSL
jgi:histidinol-phosphatase (PHP family)